MTQEIKTEPDAPAAPEPPGKISYEEFLAQTSDGTWAEWVEGEVVYMTTSKKHMELVRFLVSLLQHFTEAHEQGEVLFEPFQMKTGPDLPGRAPDVFFVAKENLARIEKHYLNGPADLVIEIISPESRGRDRGDKFYEYEQGGVREYWLLDPLRKQADFYQLGADGLYRLAPVGADGIFRSAVLEGLWLQVDWLWQEPLPPLLSVLKAWELI
jgi:Uma2 family endonuclease